MRNRKKRSAQECRHRAPATASAGERTPSCPQYGCQGTLNPYPTPQASYDSVTGLEHLRCAACGHVGVRPRNGFQLIRRDRDQHVFHYAPSLARLTVAVSPTVLGQFTRHDIGEVPALTFIAEWILLTGRPNGVVQLQGDSVVVDDCYHYFLRHVVSNHGAENAV